jgi:predicted HAD superfamily Cof-like phosphohydrolase
MTNEQKKVLAFHREFQLTVGPYPQIPSIEDQTLAIRLIREELDELVVALMTKDLVETADALGDLLYVVYGAAIRCGIDMEPVFDEIHRSNMTKVGGHKGIDGKWIKPDSYSKAKIADVLRGW